MEIKVLSNISLVDQEENRWCWVSCLQALVDSLYNRKVRQCQLARLLPENKRKHCCSNKKQCNLAIHKDEIIEVFGKEGILLRKAHHKLNDYNFIVDHLTNKRSPLLLWVDKGRSNHLVLIVGYGRKNEDRNCNFLAIFNPEGTEEFIPHSEEFKYFSDNAQLMWTTEPELSSSKLQLEEYNPKEFLPSNYREVQFDSYIIDKLIPKWAINMYLPLKLYAKEFYKYVLGIPLNREIIDEEIGFINSFRINLCDEKFFKFNDIVRRKINKRLMELGIEQNHKVFFVSEYGVIFILSSNKSVAVVKAPSGYKLETNYSKYSDFFRILNEKESIKSLINNN